MCGRTALTATPDELRDAFGLTEWPELSPRYNITPSQLLPVIRTPGKLELLRWGLVPSWAKDIQIGHTLAPGRVETIASKPAFREAIRARRCLVVVSGFYEWHRPGKKESTPFFIRRSDGKPFAVAGVWDRWVSRDGEVIESCAVLTQASRVPVDVVHDRMPLVVEREGWARWLDRTVTEPASLLEVRSPAPALVAFAVGSHVNDPRHDDPECMSEATASKQGSLWG